MLAELRILSIHIDRIVTVNTKMRVRMIYKAHATPIAMVNNATALVITEPKEELPEVSSVDGIAGLSTDLDSCC